MDLSVRCLTLHFHIETSVPDNSKKISLVNVKSDASHFTLVFFKLAVEASGKLTTELKGYKEYSRSFPNFRICE